METVNIIITIALSVIGILIGIIGFFIVRQMNRQDLTNEKLFNLIDEQKEATNKLALSITALNGTMLAINEKYEDHRADCEKHFEKLEKKIA
jgi:uncharacterized membrane-anchored protein YhcB (DUF1043 family)